MALARGEFFYFIKTWIGSNEDEEKRRKKMTLDPMSSNVTLVRSAGETILTGHNNGG